MSRNRRQIPPLASTDPLPPGMESIADNDIDEADETENTAVDPRRRAHTQRRVNPRAEADRARDRGISGDRVPLGVPTLKLSLRDYGGQLEGYVSRWVNDTGDRIQRALQGGYMPVYKHGVEVGEGDDDSYNPDQDTWVSKCVGTDEGGRPQIAYAMKIRKEWHEKDQRDKQKTVDDIDAQIKGGKVNESAGDNRYLKTAHYQIGSKT